MFEVKPKDKQFVTRYYYSPSPASAKRSLKHKPANRVHGYRLAVVVLAMLIGGWLWFSFFNDNEKNDDVAANQQTLAKVTEQPSKIVRPTVSADEMSAAINQTIANNSDVDISVTVIDLKTNSLYHYGVNNSIVFEAASVAKLITAVDYLHHVENKNYSLTQSIGGSTAQENLRKMIVESDNTAWHNLNDTLTHPDLLEYASSIGMTNYNPDSNTLNSDDVARLEKQLYQGKLLNKSNTKLLLDYMAQANRIDFIKASVPSDVKFYHKAGWLEDRDHDAAIIDNGDHPYILVILTNGHNNAHANDRTTVIQQITKATVAHFIDSTI